MFRLAKMGYNGRGNSEDDEQREDKDRPEPGEKS
jgi:hypothetical protein